MKTVFLEIFTPTKSLYSGMVKSVTVPGSCGSFQILYNHAAILSLLELGVIKINELDDKVQLFFCSGGSVEVKENKVLILAEAAENKEDIDPVRAAESLNRAKERLTAANKEVDFDRASAALKRAILRLKLKNS